MEEPKKINKKVGHHIAIFLYNIMNIFNKKKSPLKKIVKNELSKKPKSFFEKKIFGQIIFISIILFILIFKKITGISLVRAIFKFTKTEKK